jgi:type I restriction enzyme, S subunit
MTPHDFLDNFGVTTNVLGGTTPLREMILELAVRGRLVAQDPSDGNAATLVREIETERQLLGLPTSKGHSSSIWPYELPLSWAWLSLDKTFYPLSTNRKKVQLSEIKASGRYPVIDQGQAFIRGYTDNEDVLIKIPGPVIVFGDHTRELKYVDFDFVAGADGTKILRPIKVNERYFYWCLRSFRLPVRGYGRHYKLLMEQAIPLPPFSEQKRIVAKLDQLLSMCDELERQQAKKQEIGKRLTRSALEALSSAEGPEEFAEAWQRVSDNFEVLLSKPESVREMRKAILDVAIRGRLVRQNPKDEPAPTLLRTIAEEKARLIAAGSIKPGKMREEDDPIEEPFPLPAGWAWSHIGEVFNVVGGIQKTPNRAPVKNHYPYLRVENVQRGRLDLSRIERFELVEGELERWRLSPGDLLIVEGNGSETEIGRCAVWSGEINDCVHQNHLIRCRPIKPAASDFTLLFLNSPSGMAEMKELAITTSGLYSLSVGKIRGIMIPVAPLPEQKRIVAKVNQLMALCDELESKLRDAEQGAQRLAEAMTAAMVA